MIKVRWDQMHYVFITNFYDVPLTGTCLHEGKLCRFEMEWVDESDSDYYLVYPLTFVERVKAKINQWCFEVCVGHHWSYGGLRRKSFFYYRRPQWLYKLLFRLYYRVSGWISK